MADNLMIKKNNDEMNSENSVEIANAIATLKHGGDDDTPTKTAQIVDDDEMARDDDDDVTQQNEENVDDQVKSEEEQIETFAGAGSYKYQSSEHVDEYLKNLGVGLVFRKVQSAANPTMTIFPCSDDEWAIKMDSIFRTREVKFRLEEEFTDETFDGRGCRSTAKLDGPNRLIMTQRCTMGSEVKVVYECRPDSSIHVSLTCGTHSANLFFSFNSDL